MMHKQGWLFKVVPIFITAVFVLIIGMWIFMGVVVYYGSTSIGEKGLQGVVEQIWCGKQPNCSLFGVK